MRYSIIDKQLGNVIFECNELEEVFNLISMEVSYIIYDNVLKIEVGI